MPHCTKCGSSRKFTRSDLSTKCPNCGATMNVGKRDRSTLRSLGLDLPKIQAIEKTAANYKK